MEEKKRIAFSKFGDWNVTVREDSTSDLITAMQEVETMLGDGTEEQPPMPTNEELSDLKTSTEPVDQHNIPKKLTCEHENYWVNIVKKEGPNKGKHFKSCKDCKTFIEFTDEALTNAQ